MGVSFSGLLIQEQAGTSDSGKGEGTRAGGRRYLRAAESGGTHRGFFFFFFGPAERGHARAHARGESLRVMNMIIGQGTVSPSGHARAGRRGEGAGREQRVGRGAESAGGEARGEEAERRGARRRGSGRTRRELFCAALLPPAATVYYFRALPRLRAPLHNKIYFKTQLKETGRLHVTV